MEQLTLRADEFNNCTQEPEKMSEYRKAVEAKRQVNLQIKQQVDEFFQTLGPEVLAKKHRWTLAADYLNSHTDKQHSNGKKWTPQGLARICLLSEMWQRRGASPQKVTAARRKIFYSISKLLDDGLSWKQIADALNRRGLRWTPKGRKPQSFTPKSANDFYRLHHGLWTHRPRNGSKAQKSLQQLTIPIDSPSVDTKPAKTRVESRAEKPPVSSTETSTPRDQAKTFREKVRTTTTPSDSTKGSVRVLKHVNGSTGTSVKVVVCQGKDDMDVLVRYRGKINSEVTGHVMSLVNQLQKIDYSHSK